MTFALIKEPQVQSPHTALLSQLIRSYSVSPDRARSLFRQSFRSHARPSTTIRSRGPWLLQRLYCPPVSSLTMTSSETVAPLPALLFFVREVSAHWLRPGSVQQLPQFTLFIFSPCRLPYPGFRNGCFRLFLHHFQWPSSYPYRLGSSISRLPMVPGGCLTRLQSSLYATA